MQKRLTELLGYMDSRRARLLAAVADVNPDIAELRPRDDAWSVAQVVAHLAIVESNVARMIEKSVNWARQNNIDAESSDESILGSLDARNIARYPEKIPAPEATAPPADAKLETSLAGLAASRVALKHALESGDGLDLLQVKRPHRILGELNIYEWGVFIAQHEERHARQIGETIKAVSADAVQTAPII